MTPRWRDTIWHVLYAPTFNYDATPTQIKAEFDRATKAADFIRAITPPGAYQVIRRPFQQLFVKSDTDSILFLFFSSSSSFRIRTKPISTSPIMRRHSGVSKTMRRYYHSVPTDVSDLFSDGRLFFDNTAICAEDQIRPERSIELLAVCWVRFQEPSIRLLPYFARLIDSCALRFPIMFLYLRIKFPRDFRLDGPDEHENWIITAQGKG